MSHKRSKAQGMERREHRRWIPEFNPEQSLVETSPDPTGFELTHEDVRVPRYKPNVHKLSHDFKRDLEEVKRMLLNRSDRKVSDDYIVGFIDHALTEE